MPAAKSLRPVKQKRALLESNPPRDNWIERRRNKKRLRIWGGQNLPKWKKEAFISEPEHALKTHRPRSGKAPNGQPKNNGKKYLSFFSHAAFHAEPVQFNRACFIPGRSSSLKTGLGRSTAGRRIG